VAAQIRRELGEEVDMLHGHYGEFKVLVDGETLVDAGRLAFLGIFPSRKAVLAAVRTGLAS